MKRIILVLVLLVTWSLLSVPAFASSAMTEEGKNPPANQNGSQGDLVVDLTGAPNDDGSEGDPGDAGDGYGAAGNPEFTLGDGAQGSDGSIMEEYLLFLMMMVQQLAP